MSLPINIAKEVVKSLLEGRSQNIIAQTDARHILQEVREDASNYPNFDSRLTEKATHIAYTLIACGCSIVEESDTTTETVEGLSYLEKAGKILSDTYSDNTSEETSRNYSLLIAGMSLYAAKHYSRAFIALHDIDIDFSVGQIIISFIKKDFPSLIEKTNEVFFSDAPIEQGLGSLDEWIISHEIARCFMITTDYILSGSDSALSNIDELLRKLLDIAVEDKLTLYWLIIRLLKILFVTFESSSLWTVLPPRFPASELAKTYIRLLGSFTSPVTELWTSQLEALDMALAENSGAVINLRTSGGKTRVAELAILHSLMSNPLSKVLYLAPFRSLAFEIEQNLSRTFTPLGFIVTHLYGSVAVNSSDFDLVEASHIIIATPEKAKALIRGGSGIEAEINLIVIDEGHLLGIEERFIRNEMFLTHIKEYASRKNIRILILSAVLPNAGDLADWITGNSSLVAKSDWKPSIERLGLLLWDGNSVRLNWLSDGEPFNPNFVQKQSLNFSRRRKEFPDNKAEAIAATAVRLANIGTVMIYVGQARMVNSYADAVLLALGKDSDDFKWNETLWSIFENVCTEELGEDNVILNAAHKGIICHSNKLPTLVRIAIEQLMRSKSPLIIIATTTLGQGVNVGISTVIVAHPYYGKNGEYITCRDFWNICGRAGRAYSDNEGKILYAIDTARERWKVKRDDNLRRRYFSAQIENVQSGLLCALRGILNLANSVGVNFELLLEAIANDFIDLELCVGISERLKSLFNLIDDELLAMHDNFTSDKDDIDWIDDVFRRSLTIIQAETFEKENFINVIKSRVKWLTNRVMDKVERKRLIATGVPFSVSQAILKDETFFRVLATKFNADEYGIELIPSYIKEIEIWAANNAQTLLGNNPPLQSTLDSIRWEWIGGIELAQITKNYNEADKIVKEFYGFTLPWLIHAIAQIFDPSFDEYICKVYNLFALLVELGLPDETSAYVHLSGIRSRRVSVEIANLGCIHGKTFSEVKSQLMDGSIIENELSEDAKIWINSLSKAHEAQKTKNIFFSPFRLKDDIAVNRLYIREKLGKICLISEDGYFQMEVESTEKWPFSEIANQYGFYFELNREVWYLKTYNPRMSVV